MKKNGLFTILILFVISSCIKPSSREELYYSEFYSVVNDLIRYRFNDVSSIKWETLPVYRTSWGNTTPPSDTLFPPLPPPPGFIYYCEDTFKHLIKIKNIDSLEAKYMYASIDTSLTIVLDSSQISVPIISKSEFNEIFENDDFRQGYKTLREKYGSSCFIQVSTPIFNADFTKMIISVSQMCGPTWGEGSVLLLEKKQGRWRVINHWGTWVS